MYGVFSVCVAASSPGGSFTTERMICSWLLVALQELLPGLNKAQNALSPKFLNIFLI
jgi:hypothetical protein